MNKFKSMLAVAFTLALAGFAPGSLAQQENLPPLIRVIIPFGTGTSPDVLGRVTASQLGTRLGVTTVVENRSGGSTIIGAAAVVQGPRDGSMILVTSSSTYTAVASLKVVPFDTNRDLMPIAMLGDGPMMVTASAKSGIRSVADLVARARAKPDEITYGSSGIGSIAHLAVELFADAAKIKVKHIPYKSAAFALTDLNGGTIDFLLGSNTTFSSSIQSGRVIAIALTSRQPSPAFPNLPTMGSVAPGYWASNWVAAFASSGITPAMAQRLNREINEIGKSKEVMTILQNNDASPLSLSLDELRTRMREELANWVRVVTVNKIVME